MKLKLEVPEGSDLNRWQRNVYDNPSLYKLTQVACVDYSSGSYEFDYRVVWQDAEGRLWTARDSGCSCPSPFEDTTELDRLFSFEELDEEYRAEVKSVDWRDPYCSPEQWAEFKAAVMEAFKKL